MNEIVEYVSSLEASDTPHIQGLKAAMEEVETFSMPRGGDGLFSILFSLLSRVNDHLPAGNRERDSRCDLE